MKYAVPRWLLIFAAAGFLGAPAGFAIPLDSDQPAAGSRNVDTDLEATAALYASVESAKAGSHQAVPIISLTRVEWQKFGTIREYDVFYFPETRPLQADFTPDLSDATDLPRCSANDQQPVGTCPAASPLTRFAQP